MGSDGVEKEWAADGSRDCADGERMNSECVREEDAAEDRSQAVDERCDRLHGELLADEEDGSEDATGEKAELCGKQDAGELCAEVGFGGGESAKPPADVPGGSELGEEDGAAEHQRHGGEDDRHGPLAFGLAALLAIAAEHGDE